MKYLSENRYDYCHMCEVELPRTRVKRQNYTRCRSCVSKKAMTGSSFDLRKEILSDPNYCDTTRKDWESQEINVPQEPMFIKGGHR